MGLKTTIAPRSNICVQSGKDILAKGEAKSLAKRLGRRAVHPLEAYKCRCCHGWHVGHKKGSRPLASGLG